MIEANEKYSVLVCMATFNGEDFIQEQITSIRNQTGVFTTIVAQDDGSTDATLEHLRFEKIKVFNKSHRNHGSCYNFISLLHKASIELDLRDYQYVALSDQDDVWFPNKLRHAINAMTCDNSQCYSSNFQVLWGHNNVFKIGEVSKKTYNPKKMTHLFRSPGPGFTYIFSTSAFKKIISDEIVQNYLSSQTPDFRWHDWLLSVLAVKNHLKWTFDQKPGAFSRIHDTNDTGLMTSKTIWKRLRFLFDGSYLSECYKMSIVSHNDDISMALLRLSVLDRLWLLKFTIHGREKLFEQIMLLLCFLFPKKINI